MSLAELEEILGVSLKDTSLLEQALVHGSYTNENPDFALASNERLEFLGDAILSLVVAERLYQDFPDLSEGEMTKLRAALVRGETLARVAKRIRLGRFLYLGKGEEANGGRDRPANLAAALEAVIAAVFLDRGIDITKDFILKLLRVELEKIINRATGIDYKSELQEFIQAKEQRTPTYHLVEVTGPEHEKLFTVEVRSGKIVLGQGSGKNKKMAEVEAARSALMKLKV